MVSAGDAHTCGIDRGGALYCWGANFSGQLGDSTFVDRAQPSLIMEGRAWSSVEVRGDTSCAITTDKELYCWGLNDFGQLGRNTAWRTTMGLVAKPDD